MAEKLSEKTEQEGEIRIPVIQTKIVEEEAVVDAEGNVIQKAKQIRETHWLARTIPPKPLRIRRRTKCKEFPFRVSASIGKKS